MTEKPVRRALDAFWAANDCRRTATNADEGKQANRQAYEALSAVCDAYCKQYGSSKEVGPWRPEEDFPLEIALIFRAMIEGWLEGLADLGLRDLLERPGKPGPSLYERNGIEDACRYMQAAEKEIIVDKAPVSRVSAWFGVQRSTAQSWLRESRRTDLVQRFMVDASSENRATVIVERAKVSGARHRQYLAWRAARSK